MFLLMMGVTCEIFMPLFLQKLHAQSPLPAGYIAAVLSAGWALSEIISAKRTGKRIAQAIIISPKIYLSGMIVLAFVAPVKSDGELGVLIPIAIALTLIGIGIGIAWPHLSTLILKLTDIEDKHIAGSSMTTIQLFATAIGAAFTGIIVNLSGISISSSTEEYSGTARWLYITFLLLPILALHTANKVVKTTKTIRKENKIV